MIDKKLGPSTKVKVPLNDETPKRRKKIAKPKPPKLVVYHLEPMRQDELEGWWQLAVPLGKERRAIVACYDAPKADSIQWAADCLMEYWTVAGQESSLRIFNLDGTFDEERTYPRSADPKESKG